MHNYREILKAKAAALAYEAEFGADETIKLVLEDLVKFGGHVAYKFRKSQNFHLGQDFYEVLADDLEQAAKRDAHHFGQRS